MKQSLAKIRFGASWLATLYSTGFSVTAITNNILGDNRAQSILIDLPDCYGLID